MRVQDRCELYTSASREYATDQELHSQPTGTQPPNARIVRCARQVFYRTRERELWHV